MASTPHKYLDLTGLQTFYTKVKGDISTAINALDVSDISGFGAGKTLATLTETDGKIAATFQDIQIAESQVTNLVTDLGLKAPLAAPALTTGLDGATVTYPTAPTASADSNDTTIATTAFVKAAFSNADAMIFKGVVDGTTHTLPSDDYQAGWTYKVAVAGTYAGKVCEVGDMIIANKDYASGAASDADWDVIQTNIDGAVTGPASSVDGNIALFNGTTGKILKTGAQLALSNSPASKAIVTDASGHIVDADLSVVDPSVPASGTTESLSFIDSISQDAQGQITPTKKNMRAASTSQTGIVQLAGSIGATVGTENNKAASEKAVRDAINDLDAEVTSSDGTNVQVKVTEVDGVITAVNITSDLTAPLAAPALTTGLDGETVTYPTAPTASANSNDTTIATTAFVQNAVSTGTTGAFVYKGTIAGGSTGDYGALTAVAKQGDVYKVTTAGKVDGIEVEVGDMLVCNADAVAATSANYTEVAAKWDVIQGNMTAITADDIAALT